MTGVGIVSVMGVCRSREAAVSLVLGVVSMGRSGVDVHGLKGLDVLRLGDLLVGNPDGCLML